MANNTKLLQLIMEWSGKL